MSQTVADVSIDRDHNRQMAIKRLEWKIVRAAAMGQANIVERYTGQIEVIRGRLGTGKTLKKRTYRRALLGVAQEGVLPSASPASVPLPVRVTRIREGHNPSFARFEPDGQEAEHGYGV